MEWLRRKQLERCGVDFFDGYLLHNMGTNVYPRCCDYGAFDFVRQKKDEGRIGCIGCGQCEAACPQHLPVPSHLKEISNMFDGRTFFPVRR